MAEDEARGRLAEVLEIEIPIAGARIAFGEIGADLAREHGTGLGELAGFGPTQRIRPVARAWGELASALESAGAASVRELDQEQVIAFAERLWVVPPPRSMLGG